VSVCAQDYVLLVPADHYDSSTVLDVQPVDMSSVFINNCGDDHFHIE